MSTKLGIFYNRRPLPGRILSSSLLPAALEQSRRRQVQKSVDGKCQPYLETPRNTVVKILNLLERKNQTIAFSSSVKHLNMYMLLSQNGVEK